MEIQLRRSFLCCAVLATVTLVLFWQSGARPCGDDALFFNDQEASDLWTRLSPSIDASGHKKDRVRARLEALHGEIEQVCKLSGCAGASVGILHHNEVIFTDNFGFRDVDQSVLATPDTIYGIGSLTKAMVSAAIGNLIRDGKLDWTTPIKDVLPRFKQKDREVYNLTTIEDLLSHRTGLDGTVPMNYAFQGDGEMLLARDDLYPIFATLPKAHSIRSDWQYLVWGYSIVGEVIETLSGRPLKQYLNEKVFGALGMDSTTMSPSELLDSSKIAIPYASLANGTPVRLKYRQGFEGTFFEASGGVYSSVSDMLHWSKSVLGNIGRSDATNASLPNLDYAVSNHIPIQNPSLLERSYGLGWIRTQLPGVIGIIGDNVDYFDPEDEPIFSVGREPRLLVYHQGATVGYYACLLLFPETNSAIVVLTNTAALNDVADWIARAYAEALFNKAHTTDYVKLAEHSSKRLLQFYDDLQHEVEVGRRPDTRPHSLHPFVGTYHHPSLQFSIDIAEDSEVPGDLILKFQGKASQSYALRHYQDTTFEWTLSRDQTAIRGRYNVWDLSYFQFRFTDLTDQGFGKLEWPMIPDSPEVFARR